MFSGTESNVKVTSEIKTLKTNEFLRRRKLRLQQVREQSKDIAKQIRQRAQVEKQRHIVELDSRKEKEYLEQQEKIVKQLEDLYARSVQNVGASHKSASELNQPTEETRPDLSKIRGKEAAAQLRQEKQRKLDEQKRVLDRKLQARELANELFREKSKSVSNQLQTKQLPQKEANTNNIEQANIILDKDSNKENIQATVAAEQENECLTTEPINKIDMATQWNFDELPNEWEPSIPKLILPNDSKVSVENPFDKSKRLDLFAVSEEMPSSLRFGCEKVARPETNLRPSLTLVSEYLQQRNLRLREPELPAKKPDDLQSIKQTIQRTRAVRTEVPSTSDADKPSKREVSPHKKPVTVYNHSTRDRDVVHKDKGLVVRDLPNEDAYSLAMKKSVELNKDCENERKLQDMRSKVAMTKQSVEKEYNDTMSFLNSLSKDNRTRPLKQAFMDEPRQQQARDNRQRRMQQEFKRIDSECKRKSPAFGKSKSPNGHLEGSECQYSWLPVPDDAALAVHSIPNDARERGKHSVKFSKMDSHHEYRSRHKHTPPTKEKPEKSPNSSYVETMVADVSYCSSESDEFTSKKDENNMSDAERIIIYKIIESRGKKKKSKATEAKAECVTEPPPEVAKEPSTEQLQDGIYKAVNEKGDNIPSIQVTESKTKEGETVKQSCACGRLSNDSQRGPTAVQWECGDVAPQKTSNQQVEACPCQRGVAQAPPPSACSSAASFRTAAPDARAPADDDAGNFYIGATGFLKDDNYEFVIQLRKKDAIARSSERIDRPSIAKVDRSSSVSNASVTKVERDSSVSVAEAEKINPVEQNAEIDVRHEDVSTPSEQPKPMIVPEKQEPKPTIIEKETKAGVSAFTQTTLSSPLNRSMQFHMSSSASTAYLSPPDAVVPRLLQAEINKYKSKSTQCKCKKCKHAKQVTISSKDESSDTATKPCSHRDKKKECFKSSKAHSTPPKTKSCKCRKCVTKENVENHKKKSIQKAFFQLVNRTRSDNSGPNKLNPTLKSYIHRLLALNKDDLKAIETLPQECSSVATPGSSVVDAPHNAIDRDPRDVLRNQIKALIKKEMTTDRTSETDANEELDKNFRKRMHRIRKNKTAHKVKSLNISKNILKTHKRNDSMSKNDESKKAFTQKTPAFRQSSTSQKKSSSTSQSHFSQNSDAQTSYETSSTYHAAAAAAADAQARKQKKARERPTQARVTRQGNGITSDNNSPTFESILGHLIEPISYLKSSKRISSQIDKTIDDEIKLMKSAKSKYGHIDMKKIADMTEKCSQRISNLTKKLDEVRKSKSSAYSTITSSSSEALTKSDKSVSDSDGHKASSNVASDTSQHSLILAQTSDDLTKEDKNLAPSVDSLRRPEASLTSSAADSEEDANSSNDLIIKLRNKPPPTLSRICFKNDQGDIVPHELSTVLEVDSPMSLKLKSQTTSNEKTNPTETSMKSKASADSPRKQILTPKKNIAKLVVATTPKSMADQKPKMMDIKKFNEIMLKPFISVEEYAKQCKVSNAEDGSQVEENSKTAAPNEEMSSLHSDGSLPDVIAELLKRKIIEEPFKFDPASNGNTTASSETTVSINARRKKKSLFQNKENIGETSDTLSFSSQPDLENDFKQIGIGWASSTLKKTKERQALLSSSNSSTSSQNHKSKYSDKTIASILSDSILKRMLNASLQQQRRAAEISRDAEQQTSQTKSMTVKEFLTKELADKITFSEEPGQESEVFVSLYETKMPEEMKNLSNLGDRSADGSTNRARTSTPVQLFKSSAYNSSSNDSSSHKASNGLFSNADDLSSVKVTSTSMRNYSTSDKDDLTIPNYSLSLKRDHSSLSKSE